MIYGRNFFDQPITTGQGDDHTGWLLDYSYFKK